MPLTVAEAQRRRVCRICKLNDDPPPGNPLVLNYGEEYAHEHCLNRLTVRSARPGHSLTTNTERGDRPSLQLMIRTVWQNTERNQW
jgi:hypothetical protein